ncbi:MAG: hypothetical protein SNJ75_14805 [Gemmataceae bacterium]
MLSPECRQEWRESWVPHFTDAALDRLIELLGTASPLLIAGCFTRALPMGCLATHAAWHHPRTAHLTVDAGITWLHRVARLNPAISLVLREWDLRGPADWSLRRDLLAELYHERERRACLTASQPEVAYP